MRDLNMESDFLPKNEAARVAVERARRIVKENNDIISKLKAESDINEGPEDPFADASNFSYEDSYAFDLYKIKSTNGISDFFKDIFNVF